VGLACAISLAAQSEVWTFDHIDSLGGHPTTILGHPRVVDTPLGKAVEFNGVDDALFLGVHPLAGAETFTFEAIFRPDGGAREQRWFHLQEQDPKTGKDTKNRMLFEIRVEGGEWYLDAFNNSGSVSEALMSPKFMHPVGAWYHVAAVYDGHQFRDYVNGVQELSAELKLAPQGPGRSSVGVRITKVNYFNGAVRQARFTKRALTPAEFLKVPPQK
jgi:hypothetical protein